MATLCIKQNRHLTWKRCYNTRDLGGLSTQNGNETCLKALIRSDILSRLTVDGQRALLDYGVKTIIDLRSPPEVAKEPSLNLPEDGCLLRIFIGKAFDMRENRCMNG